VIIDTREKKPWDFPNSVTAKLDTGDYTIEGYEDVVVIERKGRLSEFANNITDERFERELERLSKYKYPFVVLEFDMHDIMMYPRGALPPNKWRYSRVSPHFILKRMLELQMQFNVPFILAGQYGDEIATSIFRRVIDASDK